MQFPVPQFTDIEDRIVGNLSFKQFGFVFAAAVIVFIVYTVTKATFPTIVAGVFFGLPAIALAFGRFNGRPIYQSVGSLISFGFGAKVYFFQKEAHMLPGENAPVKIDQAAPEEPGKRTTRLHELAYLLQQKEHQQEELLERSTPEKQLTQ